MTRPKGFPFHFVPRKRYGFCIAISNKPEVESTRGNLYSANLYLSPDNIVGGSIDTIEYTCAVGRTQKEAVDKCVRNIKAALWSTCKELESRS